MTKTKDHVPPKALLDKPYPDNLQVVPACKDCNAGLALDEEYFACFLDCVLSGTTQPDQVYRSSTGRSLEHSKSLRGRITSSKALIENEELVWEPEMERVNIVVTKLAKGHLASELHPVLHDPAFLFVSPKQYLTRQQVLEFESNSEFELWPEVGSKKLEESAMGRASDFQSDSGWNAIQTGVYRYRVDVAEITLVRICIREYLACIIGWNNLSG